jgi:hypothetical protein
VEDPMPMNDMTFRVAGEAGQGRTERARQQAALLALHQAVGAETAGPLSGGVQRTLWQWGRAVASWIGFL